MATIAEQWIEQGVEQGRQQGLERGLEQGLERGRREGLLKGIALGLELRFGETGGRLLPEISTIEDVARLEVIHDALRTVDDLEALRQLYQ